MPAPIAPSPAKPTRSMGLNIGRTLPVCRVARRVPDASHPGTVALYGACEAMNVPVRVEPAPLQRPIAPRRSSPVTSAAAWGIAAALPLIGFFSLLWRKELDPQW